MKEINISQIDFIIILVYLIGILLIGILSVRKKKMSSNNFYLAGRSLNWGMIGGGKGSQIGPAQAKEQQC